MYYRYVNCEHAFSFFSEKKVFFFTAMFNPIWTWDGGGRGRGFVLDPPRQILSCNQNLCAFSNAASWPFFLKSYGSFDTSFWKSDIPLETYVTFRDQGSSRKLRFFPFCVQNQRQRKICNLVYKISNISVFRYALYFFSSNWQLILIMTLSIISRKTMNYIRIKNNWILWNS